MNGQPAGSMRIMRQSAGGSLTRPAEICLCQPAKCCSCRSGGAAVLARVLADDGFHLVLERELFLFQGDFFDLFGF